MNNQEIRIALKKNKMKQWQLAELLEINESVLSRRLRKELPDKEKERILDIIRDNSQVVKG